MNTEVLTYDKLLSATTKFFPTGVFVELMELEEFTKSAKNNSLEFILYLEDIRSIMGIKFIFEVGINKFAVAYTENNTCKYSESPEIFYNFLERWILKEKKRRGLL